MGRRALVLGSILALAALSSGIAAAAEKMRVGHTIDTSVTRFAPTVSRNVTCAEIGTISCGQTIAGNINGAEDCELQVGDPPMPSGTYFDRYFLAALAGQTLTIDLESDDFDAFLLLADDAGSVLELDDNGGAGLDAQLIFEVPTDGDYLIAPSNLPDGVEGAYGLSVACEGGPPPPGPPPPAGPEEGIARISVGGLHACVLNRDGRLSCFGNNHLGQLGLGNRSRESSLKFVPIPEAILAVGIDDIVTGGGHSCLLTLNGDVHCWGANRHGQAAAPAETEFVLSPPETPVLSDVRSLAAGIVHTCAATNAGEVFCWGSNARFQLGNEGLTTRSPQYVPRPVPGLSGIQEVAVGGLHSCAIDGTGTVSCWGPNNYGQVDATLADTVGSATAITEVDEPVAALALGALHSCAWLNDGTAECWGFGQLAFDRSGGFSNLVALDSGAVHSCGLDGAGAVRCVGLNHFGQLGTSQPDLRTTSAPVPGLEADVKVLGVGDAHSCAVTGDDQFVCWGRNDEGQLGSYVKDQVLEPSVAKALGAGGER